MDKNHNLETFILVSPKKFIIAVVSNTEVDKKIYEKELLLNQDSLEVDYDKLNNFLNENIFTIEKSLDKFIKKILLILDYDVFFPVEISLKKNNFENLVDFKNLNYLLNEAKEDCKKTIENRKIIHMLITNYRADDKNFSYFPEKTRCKNFSLDIKFICLSNNLVKNLEQILKKYQISIDKILSADYMQSIPNENSPDLFALAHKVIHGLNNNEVHLVNKSIKNKGFFEKFFQFFS